MSETLDMLVVVAALVVYAVMLIVPVAEYAARRSRLNGVVRGGWMVSESGRQYFCHTTCHAPDMELYRENLKSRRHGHGF
ncbi:MAG: hypothetical protein J6Y54_06065 [Lentisphaeria bacterium]|nr:hypothetical protein [Lentisphaeria bacterium]